MVWCGVVSGVMSVVCGMVWCGVVSVCGRARCDEIQ